MKNKVFFFLTCLVVLTSIVACSGNRKETSHSNSKSKKQVLKHFAFKGIPIDGTVSEFGQKLLKHGYQLSEKQPNDSENYVVYKGLFAKRNATIDVYYSPSTKIVYKCDVVIDYGNSYDQYTSEYNFFHMLIEEKYKNCFLNADDEEGIPRQTMRFDYGEIRLKEKVSKNNDNYKLIIEYEDSKNYSSYKAEFMKDL